MRRTTSSLLALALAGCTFGFSGGGLSRDIRTVAVTPFESSIADPTLPQQVTVAVKQAVESRLGLHAATEANADAVVSGKITRYEPDMPLAFTSGPRPVSGTAAPPDVTRRQVELSVDIQIVDKRNGRILWNGQSTVVSGEYDKGGSENDGRRRALDALIKKIIDGVHSAW